MTTPRFKVGVASHVGRIRTMNEDAFVATGGVFAVADGMGGHLAGEVAAEMATASLRELAGQERITVDDVVAAVSDANDAILETSLNDASRRGMGTTLTALVMVHDAEQDGPALAVVNLGDSRTYRFHQGALQQVTVDHSYVQELVSAGHLTAEEARQHPQRNIVTRALGIEHRIGVDVWNLPLVRGDRFLLCSDGLVDEVTDERIEFLLHTMTDPQAAADALVDVANRSGGRDNVTVVVVDVLEGAEPGDATEPTRAVPVLVAAAAAAPADDDPDRDGSDGPVVGDAAITTVLPTTVAGPGTGKASVRRKLSVRWVVALAAVALPLAILLVVLRDDGSSPAPTTVVTTVPSTTVPPSTSTTAAPSTFVPTTLTLPPTTRAGS